MNIEIEFKPVKSAFTVPPISGTGRRWKRMSLESLGA